MSYMRGVLLTKMRKLVKAMEEAPPVTFPRTDGKIEFPEDLSPAVTFPRTDGKIKNIEFSEDVYVWKFNNKKKIQIRSTMTQSIATSHGRAYDPGLSFGNSPFTIEEKVSQQAD